jgi:hypothetical protein
MSLRLHRKIQYGWGIYFHQKAIPKLLQVNLLLYKRKTEFLYNGKLRWNLKSIEKNSLWKGGDEKASTTPSFISNSFSTVWIYWADTLSHQTSPSWELAGTDHWLGCPGKFPKSPLHSWPPTITSQFPNHLLPQFSTAPHWLSNLQCSVTLLYPAKSGLYSCVHWALPASFAALLRVLFIPVCVSVCHLCSVLSTGTGHTHLWIFSLVTSLSSMSVS